MNDLTTFPLARIRVLIADDNAHCRALLRAGLTRLQGAFTRDGTTVAACDIVEADNGGAALALLEQRDFDLLIADYHMPVLDGAALLERVRCMERTAELPVIMVTAAPEALLDQLRIVDTAAVLAKPFRSADVVRAVSEAYGIVAIAPRPAAPAAYFQG